jgi:hypothetical protein
VLHWGSLVLPVPWSYSLDLLGIRNWTAVSGPWNQNMELTQKERDSQPTDRHPGLLTSPRDAPPSPLGLAAVFIPNFHRRTSVRELSFSPISRPLTLISHLFPIPQRLVLPSSLTHAKNHDGPPPRGPPLTLILSSYIPFRPPNSQS